MADADVPDSTDWLPTPLHALAAVEASLRCQVCKDFYRTPMLTSCLHTFCSLCIRRALSNDGKCPLCRAGEQELKLRSNWSMEETVEAFVKARPEVLREARRRDTNRESSPKRKANATDLDADDYAPASKKVRTSARLSKNRAEARASQPVEEEQQAEEAVLEIQDDNEEDGSYTPENHDGLVACPVCNGKMKEWQVFKHLESCTGPPTTTMGSSSGPSTSSPSTFRKPLTTAPDRLPAINYSMLKDNALRKKLSDLGISASGQRSLLEKRHKEWVTLWNANCDAAKPKKRYQLLHDLEVWEKTQGGRAPAAGRLGGNGVMVKDKEFDGKAWATTHDESFKDLIAKARQSRTKPAPTTEKKDEERQTEEQNPQQEETAYIHGVQEIPSSSQPDAEDAVLQTADAIPPHHGMPEQTANPEQDWEAEGVDLGRRLRGDDNDWENIIPL